MNKDQELNLTSRMLAILEKDDFQVLCKTLRNGQTKFYQNTDMIDVFKPSTTKHTTKPHSPV
jgi:hypothetical protein